MLRARPVSAALVALGTLLAAAPVLGSVPEPANPVLNQDFEVGLPFELLIEGSPLAEPISWVGSVAPRTLDSQSRVAAPPWTATVLSGQRTPYSTTSWNPIAGTFASGGLEVVYDARDTSTESLTIAQSLGPIGVGAAPWHGGSGVRFDATVSEQGDPGTPVRAHVFIATVQKPYLWHFSEAVMVDGPMRTYVAPIAVPEDEIPFTLAIVIGQGSTGTRIVLDNVGLLVGLVGTPRDVAPIRVQLPVQAESDAQFGRCSSVPPFSVRTPIHLGLPPAGPSLSVQAFACVGGLMPVLQVCVPQPCPRSEFPVPGG